MDSIWGSEGGYFEKLQLPYEDWQKEIGIGKFKSKDRIWKMETALFTCGFLYEQKTHLNFVNKHFSFGNEARPQLLYIYIYMVG